MVRRAPPEDLQAIAGKIIRAATELAVLSERLNSHAHAPAVLRAFGLEPLLDREYAVILAEQALKGGGASKEPIHIRMGDLLNLTGGWRVLESCLGPIEKLTILAAVVEETDYDEILTLELRYEGDLHPKAETVAEVLRNSSLLYGAIARGLRQREYPPLVVIYADSGSDIRFDLSGLGEPIKEVVRGDGGSFGNRRRDNPNREIEGTGRRR